MRFLFIAVALLASADSFARTRVSQSVQGVCYSSPNCQGWASSQPMTLAQCENMIDEAYRHNGGERYGSWKASQEPSICNKSVIDARVVLQNSLSEVVRISKWYARKFPQSTTCVPRGGACFGGYCSEECCSGKGSGYSIIWGSCE